MRLYFDTSALLKKYIAEIGSDNVDKLFLSATEIYISTIGKIETISSLRRLQIEKEINQNDYDVLKKEIIHDFKFYHLIDISDDVILSSVNTIDKYQLKSLDSIHLGSALSIKINIDFFVSCDKKLLNAAKKEGFNIINPKE